jgi:hypothetical protein
MLTMVSEQCFLNLVHGFPAFGPGLTLPEHDKSLAADGAVAFGVSIGAFAQNLHDEPLGAGRIPPATKKKIGPFPQVGECLGRSSRRAVWGSSK